MIIQVDKLSYEYSPNSVFAYHALREVTTSIQEGSFTAIIGATGSGKSTLVQHFNALVTPTGGSLTVDGKHIVANQKVKELKPLRKKVGLVFQFPEYQLFEETILKDVMFGPLNFGVSIDDARSIAQESLIRVGLDSSFYERSPLELSGGQKRRVAIAGILALSPKILVLDEPTAGLDPEGSASMMSLFQNLNASGTTIIMITHDLNHVLNYATDVVMLDQGHVVFEGHKETFFNETDLHEDYGLVKPPLLALRALLKEAKISFDAHTLDVNKLAQSIKEGKHV
ncbi:MAG: energy-coupling factor transporter ATPase [Erysipelothrix sp.]|nr:energy-coupling factor transporter ATPase [Erysipelothrix sp.]